MLTTTGLRDVLEIARTTRKILYDFVAGGGGAHSVATTATEPTRTATAMSPERFLNMSFSVFGHRWLTPPSEPGHVSIKFLWYSS